MTCDGPMQFVLHDLKELVCLVGSWVVVDGKRVDVADLLVEALLRGADVSDAFQQLIEVVSAKTAALLEPLVVHDEAFQQVLPEALGGPAAELGAAEGADAVADGEDGVEVVVGDLIGLAVESSC